jgi:manganese-transporting P-type ATPase
MASNLKCAERGISARVVHRYPFSSGLKRMSVLVNATLRKETSSFVFCKGAPEVLQTLLSVVPLDYEATFLRHMKSGRRVIALTYRLLASQASASLSRTEAESGLNFLGFLVFNSALKPTTKNVIKELKAANLPLVIVTGDNVYTAADVARKLAIVKKETPLLLLEETPPLASPIAPKAMETSVGSVHWRMELMSEGVDTAEISSFSPFVVSEIAELSREHALCVSGQVLSLLEASSVSPEAYVAVLRKLCPHVKIFSRVNPLQKETITKALNLEGLHTLFCGDGTNDCGTPSLPLSL